MALLHQADSCLIEIHEHYIKQDIRNRYYIYSANGKLMLSVPVIKTNGNHTQTKDIRISHAQPWQNLHYRALCSAYNHSPFFEYYIDDFRTFFEVRHESLTEMNQKMLDILIKLIGIKTKPAYTQTFQKEYDNMSDFRNYNFINPSVSKEIFPRYIQVFETKYQFIENISILDVLFNLGPETLSYLNSIKIDS